MVDLTNNEENTPGSRMYEARLASLQKYLDDAKEILEYAQNKLDQALAGNASPTQIQELQTQIKAAEKEVKRFEDEIIMLNEAFDEGQYVRPDPVPEETKTALRDEKKSLNAEITELENKRMQVQQDAWNLGIDPKNRQHNDALAELITKDKSIGLYIEQVTNRLKEIDYLLQGQPAGSFKKQVMLSNQQNGIPQGYMFDLEHTYPGKLTDEEILKQFVEFNEKDIRPIEQKREINFVNSLDQSRQDAVTNFFNDLTLKYNDFIANRLSDTVTFSHSTQGPSIKWTIYNDKFIYVDLLAINPAKQNQQAGSLLAALTQQFAMDNGYYLITQPANQWLMETYKKYGGKEIGSGHLVVTGDIKKFEKEWYDLFHTTPSSKNLISYMPLHTYIDEYQELVKEYENLTADQKKLYAEIISSVDLDPYSREVSNSLINNTGIDNIDFQAANNLYDSNAIVNQGMRAAKNLMSKEEFLQIVSRNAFESLVSNVQDDSIFAWMLSTNNGSQFLFEMLLELEANNLDTSAEKYNDVELLKKTIEARLDSKGLLRETISLDEADALLKTTGRIFTPYDVRDPSTNALSTTLHEWNFKVSDADVEVIREFYKPEYRKQFLRSLLGTLDNEEMQNLIIDYKSAQDAAKILDLSIIKRKFTNLLKKPLEYMDFLQSGYVISDVHPTLDIGQNSLFVYHAGHPINAALGLREPDWDASSGGRTAGHGNNTYFSTNANYTQDYRGFGGANLSGRPTYAYRVDLYQSGIANENILSYTQPMTTQFTETLLENMKNAMPPSHWNKLAPVILEFLDTEDRVGRSYWDLKWYLENTYKERYRRPKSWWMKVLKNSGIKVIYHPFTGRGTGSYRTNMISSEGPIPLDTGWTARGRLEEELLFVSPEDLVYEIYEMPGTWGNTSRVDSLIDRNTLKKFNPETAVQELVSNYFNRLGNSVVKDYRGHSYFLEDILREMKIEFTNRPNFNPELKDKFIKEMESVVAQVRNMIDVEGATGKDILRAIDFNKLANEVKGEELTYQSKTDGMVVDISGEAMSEDDILYRYEMNEYNVGIKKYYLVKDNNIADNTLTLIDQDGNETIHPYSRDFIYDDELAYPSNTKMGERRDRIIKQIKDAYTFQTQLANEIASNPTITVEGEALPKSFVNWQSEEQLLRTLRSPFTNDRLIIPVYYRNNAGVPLNIDEIRAGYARHLKPTANPRGDVQYIQLAGDLMTPNNTGGSITFALNDQMLKNDQTFYEMTGEKVNPLATDNYFQVEINTKNIVDLQSLKSSEWLTSLNIEAAANAFNIPSYKLIEYLEQSELVERDKDNIWKIKATGIIDQFDEILNTKTAALAELINPNLEPEFVINKLLRAGGIEGYVSQPYLSYRNFTEAERTSSFITLFDPNDQAGIGKHTPIKPMEGRLPMGIFEIVIDDKKPPLTKYEDLRFVNDQSVLDEAFENRTLFNKGFNAIEKEALGLTGEIGELVDSSIFDKKTVKRILDVGQFIDDVTPINNATDMVISQYGQATKLTEQEALNSLRAAVETGNYLELEYLTRTGRAKGLLNKKIAQTIQYRGKLNAGLTFLNYYEIATLAAAATYGSKSVWAKELSNEVYTLTKGLLGNKYDVENLELDWEEYISALQTAEKVSPFSWLFKKVIDRPLLQTIGEYDWKSQYGDEAFGPKPYNPNAPYSVGQTIGAGALAALTPGVVMDDLLPEKPSYTMGDLAAITNYNMPTDTTIRQSTPEEQQYATAGPWGRFWMDFKDNYADFKRKQLEDKKNPWWLGEHTVSVSNSENESSSIYDKYKTPEKKWYDIGRNW